MGWVVIGAGITAATTCGIRLGDTTWQVQVDERVYQVNCIEVKESKLETSLGDGDLIDGRSVPVRTLEGVEPTDALAIRVDGVCVGGADWYLVSATGIDTARLETIVRQVRAGGYTLKTFHEQLRRYSVR
jgi:hypothetical protein